MDKVVSWEAQLHFRLTGNNKRYQLKIKGIKVYSSNKDNDKFWEYQNQNI